MALRWNPSLSIGVEEIDAQHRELFQRAGRLLEGVQAGAHEEVPELVDFLHAYAVSHFGAEEELMRELRYAGYLRHKAEHDRFASDLLTFADELEGAGPGAALSRRLNDWLARWLEDHVSGTDAELGAFLGRQKA